MSFKFIRITRQKSQQDAKNMSTSRVKHPSFEYPVSFSRKKDNSTHMRPLLNYWIEMRTEESRQIVQERERECLSSKYSADSHTWLNLSQFGAHWKRGLHGKRMRCAFPTILYNCFERNLSYTQSHTLLPSHTNTHVCGWQSGTPACGWLQALEQHVIVILVSLVSGSRTVALCGILEICACHYVICPAPESASALGLASVVPPSGGFFVPLAMCNSICATFHSGPLMWPALALETAH